MSGSKHASIHERWAHMRFSVVGQLLAAPPPKGQLRPELEKLAARTWQHPITGEPVRFAFSTIERWLHRARRERRDPVGVLRRKVRADAGSQELGVLVRQSLRAQYAAHPSWSIQLHYDNLRARSEQDSALAPVPSYSSIRRFFQGQGWRKRRRLSTRETAGAERAEARLAAREVRSYEAEYVGGLFHWDCHIGSRPVLTVRGQWATPVLFGVFDDRSRLACHLQWYLRENAQNVAHGLSQAIQKRGLPRAGKLVGVFLQACPPVRPGSHPFQDDPNLLALRTTVMDAQGRTSIIARHRLIEHLPYFLVADPVWSREYLVAPLMVESAEALALWRAIARQTQFYEVLKIIGDQMAERAVRPELGRETRQSLVFSLVIESLWALQENRVPAVPYARIQQMIRSLDDEVRAYGADAIHRFVTNTPASPQGKALGLTSESVFRSAAAPFLAQVWPQERSLATPGVSRALARLPAVAKGAFAEAVGAIDRFLVPFDSWSMLDYGLYGDEDGESKLAGIDTEEKVAALLQLLDRTIGTSEAAVVPYDLATALDQVEAISSRLVESPIFRRLAAAARRA